MVSEVLHFYYPYGHVLFGLYCLFSLFICLMGVRYLYFRYKEEAVTHSESSKQMNVPKNQFKRSSLVDDLPYILSEEVPSTKKETAEGASALV